MGAALRAGTARLPLDPEPGLPMMGYGARVGSAQGVHDPLYARALYLEGAGGRLLFVECDVCLWGVAQTRRMRDALAERTDLDPGSILIGATHTHSGPDTGLAAVLAGAEEPPHVKALVDAVLRAGAEAVAGAAPARLGVGRGALEIGRNRRSAAARPDARLHVVRVDDAGGAPRAVLYVHGCHPTALGHDNLLYSGDWPAAASRAVEEALPGALALFAPGAHADVDPRTRGLLDLAIADQSVGVSFGETEILGREAGAEVVRVAREIETRADAEVGAATRTVAIPVHGGAEGEAGRERHLAPLRADALRALDLPPDSPVRTAELYRLEAERLHGLPPAEQRPRAARVRRYLRDRTAPRLAGSLVPEVEAMVLRLGALHVLALPLECCADVGGLWRASRPGVPTALVSIANGWLRYLPHPAHFAEPRALEKYEILQSTLEPAAARRLVEAGVELDASLDAHRGGRA